MLGAFKYNGNKTYIDILGEKNYTTDEEGNIFIDKLPFGSYKAILISVPKGYIKKGSAVSRFVITEEKPVAEVSYNVIKAIKVNKGNNHTKN